MSTQLAPPPATAPAAEKPPVTLGAGDTPLVLLVSLGIALKMGAIPGIVFGGLVGLIGWGTFLTGAAVGWGFFAVLLLAVLIPTAFYPVPPKKPLMGASNPYGTGVGGTDK